jgi:hypothetical protein
MHDANLDWMLDVAGPGFSSAKGIGYWVLLVRKTLVLWFLFSLYIVLIMTWAIDEKPWTRLGEEYTGNSGLSIISS